jgi:hypothetical protein
MKQGDLITSLRFIVGLVLGILLLGILITCATNLRPLTDQARQNFLTKLVPDIKNLDEKGLIAEKKVTLAILDEGTAIVYFEPNQDTVIVQVDAKLPLTDYSIHLQKPETRSCDTGKGCICLFREPEFDTDLLDIAAKVLVQQTKKPLCAQIETTLSMNNCGIGEANFVNSYLCQNGFFIERRLAAESSWAVASYYEAPRRLDLELEKSRDRITLTG